MRQLDKSECPAVLAEKAREWLEAYLADPSNNTKRYRYRHAEIKSAIKSEAYSKCVYCESIVGHNTPGDIEHMVPTSVKPEKHFDWGNLAYSCTECNRRKKAYYSDEYPFLNPFVDNVEDMIFHCGPLVFAKEGEKRAELSLALLELDTQARDRLISRKLERILLVDGLVRAYHRENEAVMKEVLRLRILQYSGKDAEFSGAIAAFLRNIGLLQA